MIIVKLQGGLGNQMFQYAAGRTLALRHNVELKADVSYLLDRNQNLKIVFRDFDLDIFSLIKLPFATVEECSALNRRPLLKKVLSKVADGLFDSKNYLKEKSFEFDDRFNNAGSNVYLDGFWQSEKYFAEVKEQIKADFSLGPLTVEANFEFLRKINNEDSVCLNVRRGDFVSHPGSANFHGFKGLEYINAAVEHLQQKLKNPSFFIFSDDIEWCKENIRIDGALTIVDHSHAGPKFADYLQLMANCKHFIIPNSSFAWWAAWLSKSSEKIVVAPKQWFTDSSIDTSDLIPPEWIRL